MLSRDREIDALFESTIEVFEGMLLSRLPLSEEETAGFEQRVFAWFDRFTRRPGNEYLPVERFQIPLLSGACKLARDLVERKGVKIPALSSDPVDVARELGLLGAHGNPERGAPE
jgi:hypothetical protein